MSITDELREWAEDNTLRDRELTTCPPQHVVRGVLETLLRIADRIDAEHQNADDEWRTKNGDMWLKGYAACHEELMEGHPVIVADLENAGWVKLPVDSDGVPVCVGDVMEGEKIGGGYCEPFEVIGYIMSNGELEPMDEHKCPRKHKYLRHHHAPTVEDVLREFAHVGIRIAAKHGIKAGEIDFYADEDAIAEYAAKLTLRGDE